MKIKVTKCTDEVGWYSKRIGDTFKVLKESKDFEGKPVYIIDEEKSQNTTIYSYVLKDDCVIVD